MLFHKCAQQQNLNSSIHWFLQISSFFTITEKRRVQENELEGKFRQRFSSETDDNSVKCCNTLVPTQSGAARNILWVNVSGELCLAVWRVDNRAIYKLVSNIQEEKAMCLIALHMHPEQPCQRLRTNKTMTSRQQADCQHGFIGKRVVIRYHNYVTLTGCFAQE